MATEWPDIPGVTAVDGRGRLPRSPNAAVALLAEALEGSVKGGLTPSQLVDRTARITRSDRGRLHGLAGWLPLSRVAQWHAESGKLQLSSTTSLHDLSVRLGAWVSSQPVRAEFADLSLRYATGLARAAQAHNRDANQPPDQAGSVALSAMHSPDLPVHTEPTAHTSAITEKLRTLLDHLDARFLERRTHTRAGLLALLARQHVLLLGPPGTAKSMLARELCALFADTRYFEYLLSRFTHPDELFGPVSIPGLKSEDYRRLTEGFLPQAHVGFLDEIFKANSAILNSLLTLINERIFHHGRHRDTVPLMGLIGASNELPDPEGGLGALYDRFLVRLTVPPVADASSFLQVATGDLPTVSLPDEHRLTADDLAQLQALASEVRVPDNVKSALVALWRDGNTHGWDASDRRWRQAVSLLKMAAATDGRTELSTLDLLLLEWVLTPSPERAPEVREALLTQLGAGAVPQHDLRAQWMLLSVDRVAGTPEPPERSSPWTERLEVRRDSAQQLLRLHRDAVERLGADRNRIERLAQDHLWLDRLPSQVLSAHIQASRDLTQILTAAERYAKGLVSAQAAAQMHLDSLEPATKRVYGTGAVCALSVDGAEPVGITLAGQRSALRTKALGADGLVRPDSIDVPVLTLSSEALLDWLDLGEDPEHLSGTKPSWTGRNMGTALVNMRKALGNTAIPVPPELHKP